MKLFKNGRNKNIFFKVITSVLLLLHTGTMIGFSQLVKSKMEFTVTMDDSAAGCYSEALAERENGLIKSGDKLIASQF